MTNCIYKQKDTSGCIVGVSTATCCVCQSLEYSHFHGNGKYVPDVTGNCILNKGI